MTGVTTPEGDVTPAPGADPGAEEGKKTLYTLKGKVMCVVEAGVVQGSEATVATLGCVCVASGTGCVALRGGDYVGTVAVCCVA